MTASAILTDLNPPQREAVTARARAVMILAGAGSGKTRVLTRRLAHLLHSGEVSPAEVLAVTFTNKAAREMRERVVALLNLDPGQVRRLWIGTFHGMGARMLRIDADKLGYESTFTILDSADQQRLIRGLVERLDFNNRHWTPRRLANSISRWKDDGLGPDDVGGQIPFARERAQVSGFYSAYQAELRRINAMDFGDLLFNCLALWWRHPEILEGYQQRFRHLLVDEYQDTNKVQYDWMTALAGDRGNLCVVGDDDQAIYSWRGARLDNILRFEEAFPQVQVIRLEQNYRSTGNILRAAGGLIDHNVGRMGKTLVTDGDDGPLLQQYQAEDGDDEALFVAGEVVRLCDNGRYDQVAVLVRTSRQTRSLEEAMNRHSIPYRVVGGLKFMDRAEIKDAVAYLRLTYSSRDDLAFERIINTPRRMLGPKTLATIQTEAHLENGSLLDGARGVVEKQTLGKAALNRLRQFVLLIDEARLRSETHPAEKVLEYLMEASGYLESLEGGERVVEQRENLQELRGFLAVTENLAEFLEQAALEADPEQAADPDAAGRLVISTLHAAKGLEFDVVFLVGMEENLMPHKLALDSGPPGLEEERRLAYVGMTRARKLLYLCHARRRRVYDRFESMVASRFLSEIPKQLVTDRALRVSTRRWSHR